MIHPQLTKTFIEEVRLRRREAPTATPLSKREREILQKVADGATTRQVASDLGISPHTVKTHLERIFEKLGRERPSTGGRDRDPHRHRALTLGPSTQPSSDADIHRHELNVLLCDTADELARLQYHFLRARRRSGSVEVTTDAVPGRGDGGPHAARRRGVRARPSKDWAASS